MLPRLAKRVIILILFVAGALSCQIPALRAQQNTLQFKHLTINEGLSQNTVFSILQDHNGFIWLGTEDGLNCYDGYEFRIFKNELSKPGSLGNNQVNVIAEDGRGRLIAGTNGGISLFNRRTQDFLNVPIPSVKRDNQSANFVTSLVLEGRDRLWIGTYDGLKYFDLGRNAFIAAGIPDSLLQGNVQAIYKDRTNRLWVSFRSGLKCFDLRSKKALPIPLVLAGSLEEHPSTIRVIREDPAGNLWLGTETSGLFCYRGSAGVCNRYVAGTGSLPANVVRDVFFNTDGTVWIATRKGLSILDPVKQTFTNLGHDKYQAGSLSHQSVLKILRDNNGSIWVGTYAGGVNVYHPQNQTFGYIGEQFGTRSGLSNPIVSTMLTGRNGELWIGTEGGGLNWLDLETGRCESFTLPKKDNASPENIVKSIAWGTGGTLWVGAFDGLYRFDTRTRSMQPHPFLPDAKYKGRTQVYAVLHDQEGLWAGTNGGGLVHISNNGQEQVYVTEAGNPRSISGNNISALAKDQHGRLWIGTLQGLCRLDRDGKSFTRFPGERGKPYNLTNNNITSLLADSRGYLWVGTRGGGLNLLDERSGRFYALTEQNGLANNVIRAMNEDAQGRIWLSSNKGLTMVDVWPGRPELKVRELANYSVTDGLQSNQFLSGATARSENGELFFGGINGISRFFPEKMRKNTSRYPVVFTDFLINNKSAPIGTRDSPLKAHINAERNVTLAYDQANFTIRFAALNYINASKNRYAYRLEGFSNDDWHQVGEQRTATYTNLRPGDYVFMVKANAEAGPSPGAEARIHILVLPPWYKTWWAYLLYISVFCALLYLFYYFSLQTAKLKSELDFEQLNHEKDLELSQRKLSFFTHISHEIKTPLTLILSPIEKLMTNDSLNNKVQHQLQLVHRNGEKLMHLTNQLLDYRRFEAGHLNLQAAEGNLVRFTREVLTAFQSYSVSKGITLRLDAGQKSVRVWFDRDKMEKVLYNLVSNALKFTPSGGTITVSVHTQEPQNRAILRVTDNGTGIAPERLPFIFNPFETYDTHGTNQEGTGLGLSFARILVEMHHGTIRAESTPATPGARGHTAFTIGLPLGKDHLSAEEIIPDYSNSEDIKAYRQNEAELPPALLPGKKQLILAGSEQPPTLLLVEDNPEVLQFVASHFGDDFHVLTAANGNEGWQQALEHIPDLIISDVMMPGMTGTELCIRVKEDVRTSHIPVILLTARETLLYKIEGVETGADDYIVKPFSLRYLDARVWNLLESRNKLREKYSRNVTLQPTNVAISSVDEKFLEKALRYVEDNIAKESLGVEELSRGVNMSKTTLYRKLKALTGQNSNEFIRSIRLNRAAQLLLQQKLNISEVTYLVGFGDQDYFRKCFKEQFGVTPKEYAAKETIDGMKL
ncbi:hybrid sensor histidine kinase/response regulator transcription factor [Hufsiella ginkgonis]|uniref:histidine kinase n=1 Tax=Hufsiella ginkgonis TaxID=2695274 RepID=A0A7K1XXN8_9SPHI|nr:two-component regulator propeller domain-containing protein [Hufsiella ginkgonis]MXV15775.1 response regulator [Hufsiella ginkgonis]